MARVESHVEVVSNMFVANDGSVNFGGDRKHGVGSGLEGMERNAA